MIKIREATWTQKKKKKTHPFENKQTKENIVVSRINKQTEQMSKKNIKKKKKLKPKGKGKKRKKTAMCTGTLKGILVHKFCYGFLLSSHSKSVFKYRLFC